MSLELFQNDETDIIIDTDTKDVFASIRTMSNLMGVSSEEIIGFVNDMGMKLFPSIIKTSDGESEVDFLSSNQIIMTMNRFNPWFASNVSAIGGVRYYFHYLAGVDYN